jgi:aspartate/methionine/tyrosine aminotransferase
MQASPENPAQEYAKVRSNDPTTMTDRLVRPPTRMDAVQSPIIPVIGDWIRQVPGTISLGQGVVHYGPPEEAVNAAVAALGGMIGRLDTDGYPCEVRTTSRTRMPGVHDYHDGTGYGPLVAAIADKLHRENGIDVRQGSRIMVTAGANMAFMHAVLATTAPGDEVILPSPFYFNHEMAVQMAGCRAVVVPADERYEPRPDLIARALTPRTRVVVTISPNNPSGAVYCEATLRAINTLCRNHGVYHVSDEPYEYFTYGSARHVSPGAFAAAAPHTFSIYSLSKAYGFAGWRVGYVVYPEHLAGAMMKCQDTILICPTMIAQVAARAALEVGRRYCEPFVRELATIRQLVLSELATLEPLATVAAADGAFYCLLRVETSMDPMRLAERLIREHKVAVIPGPAFGMTDGCVFRVAYGALQRDTVAAGIGRLVAGLRSILSPKP